MLCTTVYATGNLSVEPILNKVYDSTAETIKVFGEFSVATHTTADLTVSSSDTLSTNSSRRYFYVSVRDGDGTALVKLQAVPTGNTTGDAGIALSADAQPYWEMPTDAIYTGHIIAHPKGTSTIRINVIEY